MKIGIDYIEAIGRSGNGRYTKSLVEKLAGIDSSNSYYLHSYMHDVLRRKDMFTSKKGNVNILGASISTFGMPLLTIPVLLINKALFCVLNFTFRIDIFHFTNPINFMSGARRSIVTVHDIAALYNSGWTKRESKVFFEKNLKKILSATDHIITVSHYTKKDIVTRFNVKEEKISVVHEAADEIFYPDTDKIYIKEKFNIKKYILYVGQLQPRKNIIRLVESYGLLSDEDRRGHSLVLVGRARDTVYKNKVVEKVKSLGLEKCVFFFDNVVDDNDLRKLYSCATFFIFPSLFEGFGLPVLEALACNTPVVASNSSSLPEVVGDAGILVNPEDAQKISFAMKEILCNRALYIDYKNKALPQAQKFSWKKNAQKTIEIYNKVYETL